MSSAVSNQDDVNKALIQLGGMKWAGLNNSDLIGAVAKVLKTETGKALIALNSNLAQITFSKLVWNESKADVRELMLSNSSSWFMTLATDAKMTPLLTASLEAYTSNITSGNATGAADYAEIVQKVQAARRKILESTGNPFAEAPTSGEIRMVAKFDELAKSRTGPHDEHHPNESAVTYPFILGKVIMMAKIESTGSIGKIKKIVDDMFKYIAVHGQKTAKTLLTTLSSHDKISGPKSKVDIWPFLKNLTSDPDFFTAGSASAQNKLIDNSTVTLKRIIRLIYICTPYKTVWGLMTVRDDTFITAIDSLFNLENQVKSPDMNSMAMIWYLCVGRSNVCSIMVDHWEESASNKLAELLGSNAQSPFSPPSYVFPLNKSVTHNFDSDEIDDVTDC